jgi:hypothetical protein
VQERKAGTGVFIGQWTDGLAGSGKLLRGLRFVAGCGYSGLVAASHDLALAPPGVCRVTGGR